MNYSATHLRSIRLRFTAVYTTVIAVVLLVLCVLVINADRRVRQSEMESDLLSRAQAGSQAVIANDDLAVATRFAADATLSDGYPQLWVVRPTDNEQGFDTIAGPAMDYYPEADISELARFAVTDNHGHQWQIWGGGDTRLWAQALPVGGEAETRVAVVALANEDDWLSQNETFRNQVLLIWSGLVIVSLLAGYVLAGRSIEPVAEALGQQERLIADAAHELRTPIARIRAAAEGGIAGDEPPDAALRRVANVAEDAGVAIDDLLTLARMDSGRQAVEQERVRLDLLAEAVADKYREVTLDTVSTVVNGDSGLLRRAIDNLIRNAVEHGRREDPNVTIQVTVYPNRVVVADSGPGFGSESPDRLFDRFHSAAGSDGHGLGLAIVSWIMDAHDGRAEASRRDGHSEFALILPE